MNRTQSTIAANDALCMGLWGLDGETVSNYRMATFYYENLLLVNELGHLVDARYKDKSNNPGYLPKSIARNLKAAGIITKVKGDAKTKINLKLLEEMVQHECVVSCINPEP